MHLTVGIETVSASHTMAALLRCVLGSAGLLETLAMEHFHLLVERDIDFRRPLPLGRVCAASGNNIKNGYSWKRICHFFWIYEAWGPTGIQNSLQIPANKCYSDFTETSFLIDFGFSVNYCINRLAGQSHYPAELLALLG